MHWCELRMHFLSIFMYFLFNVKHIEARRTLLITYSLVLQHWRIVATTWLETSEVTGVWGNCMVFWVLFNFASWHDVSFILCQGIASNNTGILPCWSLEQSVNLISEIVWIQILPFEITHLQSATFFLYTMRYRLGAGHANSCYYQ